MQMVSGWIYSVKRLKYGIQNANLIGILEKLYFHGNLIGNLREVILPF